MAEKEVNKEKKTIPRTSAAAIGVGAGLAAAALASATGNGSVFRCGYPKYKIGQPAVGCEIELNPNAQIYTSYDAALFGNNPQQMSFPDEQRIVTRAYYAVNNEYEFVGINEYNYQQHEQEILDNGGRLVVVLTAQTNNLNEPEGFIKADDIDKKIYGPVKKIGE